MPHEHKKDRQKESVKKRFHRSYLIAIGFVILLLVVISIATNHQSQPSSTTVAISTTPIIATSSTPTTIATQPSPPSTITTESNLTAVWMSGFDFKLSGKVYQPVSSSHVLTLEFNVTNRYDAPVTYVNVFVTLLALNYSNGVSVSADCTGVFGERYVSINRLRFNCSIQNMPPNATITAAFYIVTAYVRELRDTLTWHLPVRVPSAFTALPVT